ncbi:hypothetical protein BSKO_01931 [Bryopsis sp. KO-2023]|nr:hypothetical protein BSKO_01931 [Bryopsis sp. KO-2023]
MMLGFTCKCDFDGTTMSFGTCLIPPPSVSGIRTVSTRTWFLGGKRTPAMQGKTYAEQIGTTRRRRACEQTALLHRSDSLADLKEPLSPREALSHVTTEVFLVFRLAIKLWSYLGLGWRWLWNFCRLFLYATILSPGFLQMVYYYFFSGQVSRSIPYGRKPRNRLDLYTPSTQLAKGASWPVVIFITGGAWTIGYKAWGSLLGRRLSEMGVMVVSLDYRNFPQGSALDMLEDVNTGISWVLRHIDEYDGDVRNVHLVGQSAGGHLAALSLLTQVQRRVFGSSKLGVGRDWDPLDLQSFIGVSGAYCLESLSEHLHSRGLYKSLFEQIMMIDGEVSLQTLSPLNIAQKLRGFLRGQLPEILLLHGKADRTVPCNSSMEFAQILQESSVQCSCKIYIGKSHTEPLVEDPMRGGRDHLMEDVLEKVLRHTVSMEVKPLVPGFLVDAASKICPF